MVVTFEQKRQKLQKFYDEWVKPMKRVMPSNLLVDLESMIKEYSLVK